MSIAEQTLHADLMRELRQDLAATRTALERSLAERDQWRTKYQDAAFRMEQLRFAVAKLFKETANG